VPWSRVGWQNAGGRIRIIAPRHLGAPRTASRVTSWLPTVAGVIWSGVGSWGGVVIGNRRRNRPHAPPASRVRHHDARPPARRSPARSHRHHATCYAIHETTGGYGRYQDHNRQHLRQCRAAVGGLPEKSSRALRRHPTRPSGATRRDDPRPLKDYPSGPNYVLATVTSVTNPHGSETSDGTLKSYPSSVGRSALEAKLIWV
jgi:hypothetical protein